VTVVVTLRARVASSRVPLLVAALATGTFVLLAVVDPHEPGRYPPCPWYALTGLWCPGCGGLRAAHDLATGDPIAAVSSNVLAVALVPVVALLWWRWLRRRWSGQSTGPPTLSPRATLVLVAGALIFTVVRNLPAGAALAP
jgi:Protein of unknown function (DUF2752)